MARFRCVGCGKEGEFAYDPMRHDCPLCGSAEVVFAMAIDELPDELFEALALPEHGDEIETDED